MTVADKENDVIAKTADDCAVNVEADIIPTEDAEEIADSTPSVPTDDEAVADITDKEACAPADSPEIKKDSDALPTVQETIANDNADYFGADRPEGENDVSDNEEDRTRGAEALQECSEEFLLPGSAEWTDEQLSMVPTSEDDEIPPVIADEGEIPTDSAPKDESGEAESVPQEREPIPTEGYFPTASGYGDSLSDETLQQDEEQFHLNIPPVDGESEAIAEEDVSEDITENPTEERDKSESKTEPKTRFVDTLFDFVELAIFTLAAIMIITSFFFRHSIVEGDSMLGTLEDGQHLIISDFMYEPKYGDIVVVEDYTTALKKPIIKRVIATEGQKVRIDANGVTVDGARLNEDYVYFSVGSYYYDVYPSQALLENETLEIAPGIFYEFTVPEGEIFVMGDHRNNSTDSRHIGTIDEEAIIGRVILRFYPFDSFGTVSD